MFEFNQIKEAYIKLKSYIYYDNTDILLRRQLVEFETNRSKDSLFRAFGGPEPYKNYQDDDDYTADTVLEFKLKSINNALNIYHKDPAFFDFFLNELDVNFYPKGIKEEELDANFITNVRVKEKYHIERVTAFVQAPIEIHIISVLWIMEYGVGMDSVLSDDCHGNRLLLNQNGSKLVQGSSLFKPYVKQYQTWRDESVKVAQNLLNKNKNVLFLNLDIRDYFHSVRIPKLTLFNGRKSNASAQQPKYNLKEIFQKIHHNYTVIIGENYLQPHDFYGFLKRDSDDQITEYILPIGLVSSYVLANHYLKDFDTRIIQKIKPAYYGRYVDDILIVISEATADYHDNETVEEIKFSFDDYKTKINALGKDKISFDKDKLTKLEKYVLETFYPVIDLVDLPKHLNVKANKEMDQKIFRIKGYESLYFQSEKSVVYYFDHKESNLVIDKLKKDLNERTSEFKDFPEDDENEESLEKSAYHLMYDGSEGKIRTLKDYKEDRFGLTIYLSNKIFSALRHDNSITEDEKDQVLKFFMGANCLTFYRLWERIFTLLLVTKHARGYVDFYLHCYEQIKRLKDGIPGTKVTEEMIKGTLNEYLDCCHELSISLNPMFIQKTKDALDHFHFNLSSIEAEITQSFNRKFEPTRSDSYWITRFRETNMIRQHYVIQPLLSFTVDSKLKALDLTSLELKLENYSLDKDLIENSPRPVKYWECCIAIAFDKIKNFKKSAVDSETGYILNDLLDIEPLLPENDENPNNKQDYKFYLKDAFDLYLRLNRNHIPKHITEDPRYRDNFFIGHQESLNIDKSRPTTVHELRVGNGEKNANPKIAFANTQVDEVSIVKSIRKTPDLSIQRYRKIASILKKARVEKADILLFPEFFMPINLLSSIARFSQKNEMLTVVGLEHLTIDSVSFNFVVTCLPITVNGILDAVIVIRLKNHYAPIEELLIEGNHCLVPKPSVYRYDLFIWKNIYFSTYYCFELANSLHRSLLKAKIDLLIGIEWNKDTSYYSNIVEAVSRDLHSYVAQVNTSQFGDSRLTRPVESARKDLLRLKGGINDAILVSKINIESLREFQRKKFSITHHLKEFKPLPPDFALVDVLKRIENKSMIE